MNWVKKEWNNCIIKKTYLFFKNYKDEDKNLRLTITGFTLALIICGASIAVWENIHQAQKLEFTFYHLFGSLFFLFSLFTILWYLFLDNVEFIQKNRNFGLLGVFSRIVIFIMAIPICIILSLMCLDLISFLKNPIQATNTLYQDVEINNILFRFYKGTLAIIVLSVSSYVAYVRTQSMKQTEKTFEFSQKQFNETQIQKLNEEIEKRFQEGIKLLGNDNESVRLGGIYILWEIVKDAVKALPYLEAKHDAHVKKFKKFDKTNENNEAEINGYKKAYTLHKQILDILCAHVRTTTNSKEYLFEYYPSIAKERFPRQFKEVFGESEGNNSKKLDEKPSNEIQTLLDLLTKSSNTKELYIPNDKLGFKLNFNKAVLNGTDCYNAYFKNANCSEAYFQHANCSGAIFEGANCWSTHFEGAECNYSHFEDSKCSETHFEKSILNHANFERSECINTHFEDANCKEAYFISAILNGAHFEQSHCDNAYFEDAECSHAYFQEAVLDNAHFERSQCSHVHFERTKCCETHFENSICREAYFEGADCNQAHFEGADCTEAHFQRAICIGAHFESTNCTHANFESVTFVIYEYSIYKVSFEGAILDQTIFSESNIRHCLFDGINSVLGECGVVKTEFDPDEPNNNEPDLDGIYDNYKFEASIFLVSEKVDYSIPQQYISYEDKDEFANKFNCPSLKLVNPWRISITEVKRFLDLGLFEDDLEINECLEEFQKLYEESDKKTDAFFNLIKENTNMKEKVKKYLNDFDDYS